MDTIAKDALNSVSLHITLFDHSHPSLHLHQFAVTIHIRSLIKDISPKKENTTQTVDISPTQQTSATSEPVVSMEINPLPSKKSKEKETLEETSVKMTSTLDIDTILTCQRTS
ncbi:10121_t:CDS:2 [Funneliformis geosporum]|nr:10121_t:CDS:2 [Funneliformis geosporum]